MPQFEKTKETILYPVPPVGSIITAVKSEDMEIYSRFMRHIRHVPSSRTEIKILSAIQFTADMLGYSDAHISKTLVDLGLRARRMAFPASFLEYADNALMRSGWEVGGPSGSLQELQDHWGKIGEDKFAGFKRNYSFFDGERALHSL